MIRSFSKQINKYKHDIATHKRVVTIGLVLGTLSLLPILAASGEWQQGVPKVQVRQINYAVRARHRVSRRASIAAFTIQKRDGIPLTSHRARSARKTGIAKRSTVQLTTKQASFVKNLGVYLHSIGESAVVTSGARTPEHQLQIIKSKIRSMGASRRFAQLRHATVAKVNSWLPALAYLRARHVPVYAPKATMATVMCTSNHIKGLAVDLVGGSLSHLRSAVLGFAQSEYAKHAALKVLSVAQEPGCVHINLAPQTRRGG